MKKITILSAAAILGCMAMTSCSDYLDADNKSAGSDADSYFGTTEGLAAARTQAYYTLKANAENFTLYCDGTDLYIPVRGNVPSDYQKYTNTANMDEVKNYYANCYDEVKYGMYYAEKSGEGTLGNAEGRFIRDYAYYQLTQQFGGVPYIDHYVSDANREYPKASVDSLYTIMEADLENIYNSGLLPQTDHKNGYISQQAVAALLAKFYLAHAWDVDTQEGDAARGTYTVHSTANFQKAAQWAKTAIGGQGLTQSFDAKWSPSNEGNDEVIWSIQYERSGYPGSDDGGHGLQNQYGNYYDSPTLSGQKYVKSTGQASAKAIYLWDKGDDRYEATFMTKMYNYDNEHWGTTGYYAYYNASSAALAQMPYAYRYFPYYTTEAEARAEFAAHPEHYTQGSYHTPVTAYILSNPIKKFQFNANGTVSSTSEITYNSASLTQGGTGACVKKFDDPETQAAGTNSKIDYRDIVVFDLSDMYLTVAEADLLAGNEAEALQYVNAVRDRAHASHLASFGSYQEEYSSPSSFGAITPLDVILDERARELFGQQVRWVDLRRTKQLVRYNIAFNDAISSVADMEGLDGQIKWLRPLPQAAIDGNYSLSADDQNPGY